jgi:branched-chain amino acid transport system permease protein
MISKDEIRETVKIGLIAGAVTLCFSLIGFITSFDQRDIISEYLSLGQVMLFSGALLAGFWSVTRREEVAIPARLVNGLLAGLLTAVPTFLLLLVTLSWVTIRDSFINVSPDLISILTFGNENVVTGGLILTLLFVVIGGIGAVIDLIPGRVRDGLLTAVLWTIGIGLMSDIIIGILRSRLSSDALDGIFGDTGLQLVSFIILFVGIAAGTYWWRGGGRDQMQGAREKLPAAQQKLLRRVWIFLVVLFLLVLPSLLGVYLSEIINTVGLYVLMGLGLNIAIGLAGLLDLGYVTNFAVGAYIMALLTSSSEYGLASPISFWFALPICVGAAMITGFVLALPVLKMRGDYLAIATLGFGEIIRVLARSDALKPVIGGAQGILQIPQAKIAGFFGNALSSILGPINNGLEAIGLGILSPTNGEILFDKPPQLYYLILLASLLMLLVSRQLNNSRTGRRWMAIREDEDVAAAMGINTTNAKVIAFTLSAASGGLAGAIFAAKLGSIFPHSFQLLISVNVLSLIIVGGLGSIPGVIVGAFALVGVPELLREFAEFRLLFYGIALIVMMLVRPEGLWPSEVRRRELQSDDVVSPAPPAPAAGD